MLQDKNKYNTFIRMVSLKLNSKTTTIQIKIKL